MSRRFAIVDVFAEAKYEGNQLAVVRDAEGLSSGEMQRIAREFNYPETSFVLGGVARDGAYDVRIFTPAEEVPFAGHPALGRVACTQVAGVVLWQDGHLCPPPGTAYALRHSPCGMQPDAVD